MYLFGLGRRHIDCAPDAFESQELPGAEQRLRALERACSAAVDGRERRQLHGRTARCTIRPSQCMQARTTARSAVQSDEITSNSSSSSSSSQRRLYTLIVYMYTVYMSRSENVFAHLFSSDIDDCEKSVGARWIAGRRRYILSFANQVVTHISPTRFVHAH